MAIILQSRFFFLHSRKLINEIIRRSAFPKKLENILSLLSNETARCYNLVPNYRRVNGLTPVFHLLDSIGQVKRMNKFVSRGFELLTGMILLCDIIVIHFLMMIFKEKFSVLHTIVFNTVSVTKR